MSAVNVFQSTQAWQTLLKRGPSIEPIIEWLGNRVWTASNIQHVPHHKCLKPTTRNPRERLRWDAYAAALSSTC